MNLREELLKTQPEKLPLFELVRDYLDKKPFIKIDEKSFDYEGLRSYDGCLYQREEDKQKPIPELKIRDYQLFFVIDRGDDAEIRFYGHSFPSFKSGKDNKKLAEDFIVYEFTKNFLEGKAIFDGNWISVIPEKKDDIDNFVDLMVEYKKIITSDEFKNKKIKLGGNFRDLIKHEL